MENKKKSGFLMQGGILAAAGLLTRFIGMLYRIPLERTVGREGMGYYSNAYEIYNIALLVSCYSVPVAVSKLIADKDGKGEYQNSARYFKYAMMLSSCIGLVVSLIVFIFADKIANAFEYPSSVIPLRVLAPTIFVFSLMGVIRGFFQGKRTMVPTAVSQIIAGSYDQTAGKRITDMYNPFSLVNAFNSGKVTNYWFDRGTSSALFEMLSQMPALDLATLEGRECSASAFDLPLESFDDPLPVLYQSGYLTIKDYDKEFDDYTLGIPNQEVRRGFAECLYRHVAAVGGSDENKSNLFGAYKQFSRHNDLPTFIEAIKTFFAGVPYHLQQDNKNEHYYHSLLYTLLVAFGADVRAEDPSAKGRADIVLLMPKGIYVMELKYDGTPQEALEQIDRKGYAEKYRLDGRPITKIGISFSSEEHNISNWQSVAL